jgi:hypothetical protein
MTLYEPESDGSKTKRRNPKTKRPPDDREGVNRHGQSDNFGARGALSKQEDALAKGNVVLSKPDAAFSSARALFAAATTR